MMSKKYEPIVYKNLTIGDLDNKERFFEDCEFVNCYFSYADLSQKVFVNCVMDTCNLSLSKIVNTGFQNVLFRECKITGVNFSNSKSFSFAVSFENCSLDYSIFHKLRLKETKFTGCSLVESDFTEADLSRSVFLNCDLNRTVFNRTILKEVDFTTSNNFIIDPESNTITKSKFSYNSLSNLLTKYNLVIER